jgi:mannose/cellobiose epimerase-like protein (N-acyl-D-glucosamine 2-epimerase family)
MAGRLGTLTLIAALALCALTGCDSSKGGAGEKVSKHATSGTDWLRENLIRGVVEPRLRHGLLPGGFYQPNLGPDWAPVPPQTATLISQTRIVYVMAMGYEVSGDPQYLDAMKRAADYLLAHFADPRAPGRWVGSVSADGKAVSNTFHAYGHAHVVLALAHAFKVSKDERYLDAAMHTWLALDVPGAIAGKNNLYELRGLNVAMHTFEALLVLFKATDSKLVRSDLKALGDHIVGRFFDPQSGYFAEGLTPELAREPGGEVRLGHSIEMAFLLSRAVDAGLPPVYLEPANAAVDFVARIAARDARGIIPHTVDYAGNVRDAEYYWWCQTELLRGLAHFSMQRGRDDLRAQFEKTLRTVRTLYVDPEDGSWYGKPLAKDQNRGHDWKVGYHVGMMVTEIMRLNGMGFRSGREVLL